MKYLILPLLSLVFGTGCVLTPTGEIITPPISVNAEIGLGPRIHIGSRSSVTVWLGSSYIVSDAYPIAQTHCSRWGMYASPRRDWTRSHHSARYLDYVCVRRRPYLADIHIIGRRQHKGHYRNAGRYSPHRRVYTPKPVPVKKRRTFGGGATYHNKYKQVERGKPWEHSTRKSKAYSPKTPVPKRSTFTERGKPWEHNVNKNKAKSSLKLHSKPAKRSTFGGLNSKMKTKTTVTKTKFKSYGSLKTKRKPTKRGTLRL